MRSISAIAVASLLIAFSAFAQSPVAIGGVLAIPVEVRSILGPVPGVRIEITSALGVRAAGVTDAAGRVTIRVPELGIYKIRAIGNNGAVLAEGTASVGPGGSEVVTLQMGPVPVGDSSP